MCMSDAAIWFSPHFSVKPPPTQDPGYAADVVPSITSVRSSILWLHFFKLLSMLLFPKFLLHSNICLCQLTRCLMLAIFLNLFIFNHSHFLRFHIPGLPGTSVVFIYTKSPLFTPTAETRKISYLYRPWGDAFDRVQLSCSD